MAVRTLTHIHGDISTQMQLTHSLTREKRSKHYWKIGRQVFGTVTGIESDVYLCIAVRVPMCPCAHACVYTVHVIGGADADVNEAVAMTLK